MPTGDCTPGLSRSSRPIMIVRASRDAKGWHHAAVRATESPYSRPNTLALSSTIRNEVASPFAVDRLGLLRSRPLATTPFRRFSGVVAGGFANRRAERSFCPVETPFYDQGIGMYGFPTPDRVFANRRLFRAEIELRKLPFLGYT